MSAAEPRLHPKYARAKVLGEKITELVGYINAATYDLLVMIRGVFDSAIALKINPHPSQ